MTDRDVNALAALCTDRSALRNALVVVLGQPGGYSWIAVAEEAIEAMVYGLPDWELQSPDGIEMTAEEVVERCSLLAFVDSEIVQAVLFGATVLRLPMCVLCSAEAKYNAQIRTTKEYLHLCQKHFTEYGVKRVPPNFTVIKPSTLLSGNGSDPKLPEGSNTSQESKGTKSMHGETTETVLTYRDYVAALYQKTIRYFDQPIDPDYLEMRIKLLGEVFLAEDSGSGQDSLGFGQVRDDHFLSGKSMKPLDLFGVEGHLEGFEALATAWNRMRDAHGAQIEAIEEAVHRLRQDWILFYLEAHLSEEAKNRTVTLQTLIERGLPERPPPFDPFENY